MWLSVIVRASLLIWFFLMQAELAEWQFGDAALPLPLAALLVTLAAVAGAYVLPPPWLPRWSATVLLGLLGLGFALFGSPILAGPLGAGEGGGFFEVLAVAAWMGKVVLIAVLILAATLAAIVVGNFVLSLFDQAPRKYLAQAPWDALVPLSWGAITLESILLAPQWVGWMTVLTVVLLTALLAPVARDTGRPFLFALLRAMREEAVATREEVPRAPPIRIVPPTPAPVQAARDPEGERLALLRSLLAADPAELPRAA